MMPVGEMSRHYKSYDKSFCMNKMFCQSIQQSLRYFRLRESDGPNRKYHTDSTNYCD